MHREVAPFDVTALAQACKNSGGKVVVQVEKIVQGGTLDPKLVAIPGIYVDAIVVGDPKVNQQCIGEEYDGSLTGEYRVPLDAIPTFPWMQKKSSPAVQSWNCRVTLSSISESAHRKKSPMSLLRKGFPIT